MRFINKILNREEIFFIIGTGRSGTHLLGRTISSSEKVQGFIEDEKVFKFSSKIIASGGYSTKQIRQIIKGYKSLYKSSDKFILDKTHPNIWIVEQLENYFPRSKFIGIKRDVYATVASMLRHKGILQWYKTIPNNKVNPFLGITAENVFEFKDLPLESKCTLRVLSHYKRLDDLKKIFPKKILVVQYEDFYYSPEAIKREIECFIGDEINLSIEKLKPHSIDKWKKELSPIQVSNISRTIKDFHNA